MKFVILLVGLFCCSFNASSQMNVDDICNKHIESKGGREKLKTLLAVTVEQQLLSNHMETPQKLTIILNRAFYSKANFQGGEVIVSLKDGQGWQINSFATGTDEPQALSEKEAKLYSYQTDLAGPLFDYNRKGIKVALAGKENVLGEEAYHLTATYPNGYKANLFISTKTYYLLKLVDSFQETLFSDYRKIDGYTFPFATEVNSKRGSLTVNVFKITINPNVNEAIFKMPRS